MLDKREQAFEQGFVHDEAVRFNILSLRNKLFGHWAAEQLGYSGEVADRYRETIVAALCEPFDGILEADDKVVSRVVLDLTNADRTMSPAEVRGVLKEFEDKAKADLE